MSDVITSKRKHKPHREQPVAAAQNEDALLQIITVSALLGLGCSTIRAMVSRDEFPKPIRRGTRCTRWRAGDVTAWLKSQVPA